MKILALIPARGGSKGIARKNLRLAAGTPLVGHCIMQALESRHINRVIVSTDDAEIASVAQAYGAETPFLRPAVYATDTAIDLHVFTHCLEWLRANENYEPDLVVQLRASAPVRRASTIDLAIEYILADPEADSLRSVSVAPFTPYKMWTVTDSGHLGPVMSSPGVNDWFDQPRQELPLVYVQNGLIDIVRPRTVLDMRSMAGKNILAFTHSDPVIDIDDEAALHEATLLMQRNDLSGIRTDVPLTPRLGIMQGRLTPAPDGVLQAFPVAGWAQEFQTASDLGLSHIELLVERQARSGTPFLSNEYGVRMAELVKATSVVTDCACVDFVLDHDLRDPSFMEMLFSIFDRLVSHGVRKVIIPLFEQSECTSQNLQSFAVVLNKYASYIKGRSVLCVESNLSVGDVQRLIGLVGNPDIRVCLDTGNLTKQGYDVPAYIRQLKTLVGSIHLKDKDGNGSNVMLGDGEADFPEIFRALSEIGYVGGLTLETTRGYDAVQTARRHIKFVAAHLSGGQE